MTTNETTSARTRYEASLREMSVAALLDQLESGVRQNSYGSHNDQNALVRAEIHRRTR